MTLTKSEDAPTLSESLKWIYFGLSVLFLATRRQLRFMHRFNKENASN